MKKLLYTLSSAIVLVVILNSCGEFSPGQVKKIPSKYKKEVSRALVYAGNNRPELLNLVDAIPDSLIEDMCFLLMHMPERDLQSLSKDFLYRNIVHSRKVWEESPWFDQVSYEQYLNYILPYANVNERRDDYKEAFYNQFYTLVKDCKTPGEAAVELNNQIWDILNVHYSTKRPKADQSPYESIDASMASCTGLSILLIDVCRSVGVPMRFVGAPKWVTVPGNHSWVEVWDNNTWNFLGAWEPGPLNKTWFQHRASFADSTNYMHSIYAVSYQKTDILFPTVWDSTVNYVYAENISSRYSKAQSDEENVELAVRVYDNTNNERITANVKLMYNGKNVQEGMSKDKFHDTNDVLSFQVEQHVEVELVVTFQERIVTQKVLTTDMRVQIVDISI